MAPPSARLGVARRPARLSRRPGWKWTRRRSPARVVRRGGHDDSQPRDVRKPGMERLRVLRALLAAAVDDGANGERHRHLPAEHVAPLRRLVDDLVHCEHREIDSGMDDYRALAA